MGSASSSTHHVSGPPPSRAKGVDDGLEHVVVDGKAIGQVVVEDDLEHASLVGGRDLGERPQPATVGDRGGDEPVTPSLARGRARDGR